MELENEAEDELEGWAKKQETSASEENVTSQNAPSEPVSEEPVFCPPVYLEKATINVIAQPKEQIDET